MAKGGLQPVSTTLPCDGTIWVIQKGPISILRSPVLRRRPRRLLLFLAEKGNFPLFLLFQLVYRQGCLKYLTILGDTCGFHSGRYRHAPRQQEQGLPYTTRNSGLLLLPSDDLFFVRWLRFPGAINRDTGTDIRKTHDR
mmetsp:Transcript_36935/g.98156  ORF Transcript_36935/g.98156 Transcript_36935/m.98156 type:complete len:139 (+) Transcript_36935:2458-2874(+)